MRHEKNTSAFFEESPDLLRVGPRIYNRENNSWIFCNPPFIFTCPAPRSHDKPSAPSHFCAHQSRRSAPGFLQINMNHPRISPRKIYSAKPISFGSIIHISKGFRRMLRVIRLETGECSSVIRPEAGEDRTLLLNIVLRTLRTRRMHQHSSSSKGHQ
jgi:hypothetical protein